MTYPKRNLPDDIISCDIRNVPEDNSFIEAVIVVKLWLWRNKSVASPSLKKKKKILSRSVDFLCLFLPLTHIHLPVAKTKVRRSEGQRWETGFIKISIRIQWNKQWHHIHSMGQSTVKGLGTHEHPQSGLCFHNFSFWKVGLFVFPSRLSIFILH